jgi:hypothetical protein
MNKNIIMLLNEYLEITKVMYSSIKARDIDIFENQLKVRADVIIQIEKEEEKHLKQSEIEEIKQSILEFEDKIEKEITEFKKDTLKEQNLNKIKLNSLKKTSVISNKYKYGSVETYKSSFDKRK